MSEFINLLNLDDATLRDLADVEENAAVKGQYFLELAHRAMSRGEEGRIDYEVWLKKAIECGNEEAGEEHREFCLRKENTAEKKDAAIRERIREIRTLTQAQTSELVQKGEMAAIYVFCERVVSRRLVTSGDLDNIAGKMRKLSDQMSLNPENVIPYDLMGELYFKIGNMYEQKGNVEKAVMNYGNAAEYGNLNAMRILRSGKLGNENCEKYAQNAAAIGNAEDKFISLEMTLKGRRYEEADIQIVDMLKAGGKTMDDLYRWAGEILKYDYTDGAITVYEYIMDSAEEDTACRKLALWMYNALNGTEPEELWEIAQRFSREEKAGLTDAMSLYLNFSLKQNDHDGNGIRVSLKDINSDGIDIWIYNTQVTDGVPDGRCEIRSFTRLALPEIIPETIMDTFEAHDFVWRAEAEMHSGEIGEINEMRDHQDRPAAPKLAECFIRRGLRYTDESGSFIMTLDEPGKVLKCTVSGIKNEGGDTIAEQCIVYEGSVKGELAEGKGVRYLFSNINASQLSPDRLLQECQTIPFDEKYEGDFRSGQYWGQGKKELKDGRCWEGTFAAGKADGIARWHYADGKQCGIFTFKAGNPISGCKLRITGKNPDGTNKAKLYKGEYHGNNLPDGQGVYLEIDSLPEEQADIGYLSEHFDDLHYTWKHTGFFKNGYTLEGKGEETEAENGEWNRQWKGFYVNGKLQGNGQLKCRDGRFYTGLWKDGLLISGIVLLKDMCGEWDILTGESISSPIVQGNDYHFRNLPDTICCENIETLNLDDLPFSWHYTGRLKIYLPNGHGSIVFKEAPDEIRYSGEMLRTGKGQFVAIEDNHSWKEMDASFHDMNGQGRRMDVTELHDDGTADAYYYSGELADGAPEGKGISGRFMRKELSKLTYDVLSRKEIQKLDFEDKYEGEFVNGEASGQGKLTDRFGNCWEGEFAHRLPDGQCTYTFSSNDPSDKDSREYTGQFVNGKEEGMGCFVRYRENMDIDASCSGFAFAGQFENGAASGTGKAKQFSKLTNDHAHAEYIRDHFDELFCVKRMEGTFNSAMELDGFGKAVVLDNCLIWERTGIFRGNRLDGEGECCLYTDSSLTENDQYLDDMNAFSPVWRFRGRLKDGMPCESGSLSVPASSEWYKPLHACLREKEDGNKPITLSIEGFSGEWGAKCAVQKIEKLLFPNGDSYSGETDEMLRPDGNGRMHYADHEDLCYIGSFSEGQRHGTGRLMSGKKTIYEGEWRKDHITDKIHFSQKKYKDFL